jgi:serine/threonine-protein kinase
MELLDGESLAARVARGPLLPLEVISIARQLANALGAAHDRGVIHADVTPANAFILHDSLHVKLLDFGLAQLAGESAEDNPDFVVGTPSYISPEQLRGQGATERSDQYGLGAVLFELLTGAPPFVEGDVHAICMQHLTAPIPEITSPHGPVPTKLANLIVTCLQKSPQARFANMRALLGLLDDLERVVERSGWRRWLGA